MSQRNSQKTLKLTYVALFVVVLAICSWISIPTAVPFTLQTLAVFLVLMLLGGKLGTLSIAVWLLLGGVGVPVFAGFKGGVGALIGPTGGYLLGFLLTGLIFWGMTKVFGEKLIPQILGLVIGLAVCYTFGTIWFVHIYVGDTVMSYGVALAWCVIPFILPDLLKMAIAVTLGSKLKPYLKLEK